MNGREMFRHASAKQANAQTNEATEQTEWSKVKADARCPSSKKQFKQQRQQRQRQCRLKNDLIFDLQISREFRFNRFVCTVGLKRVQFEILLICLSFHRLTHYMTKTIIDIRSNEKLQNLPTLSNLTFLEKDRESYLRSRLSDI